MPSRLPPRPKRPSLARLLVAAAALVTAARAQDTGVAGTMPEDFMPGLGSLLDTALRQSPTMISAELQVAVAEASRHMYGVAPMLPNAAVLLGYGRSTQTLSNNSAASSGQNGLVYNANVSQPVFQWGVLRNQLEVTTIAELIQRKNYAEGYRNFVGTLRRQYMGLIQARVDLRNARYALSASRAALDLLNDKARHGTVPANLIGAAQLDLDDKQLAADRAEQAYVFARRTLAHEAGIADLDDATIPSEVPSPKYSPKASAYLLAGLLREGGRNTLEAQVNLLQIRQSDLDYKVAKVRLLPKFYVSAGISQYTSTSATPTSVSQNLVLNKTYYLNANWTLFDGLATHWAKVQALEQRRVFERQLEIVTDGVMDQAENSSRAVEFSWRALDLANRRLDAAKASLGYVRNELGLGHATPEDVAAAQGAVYLYESGEAAARADFFNTWSGFVSLVGADPAMNRLPNRYVRDIR